MDLFHPLAQTGLTQGEYERRPISINDLMQALKPPRTPDGQPDLQGVWLNASATPLERPKALEGLWILREVFGIPLTPEAGVRR